MPSGWTRAAEERWPLEEPNRGLRQWATMEADKVFAYQDGAGWTSEYYYDGDDELPFLTIKDGEVVGPDGQRFPVERCEIRDGHVKCGDLRFPL